jgi:hypothetical protein
MILRRDKSKHRMAEGDRGSEKTIRLRGVREDDQPPALWQKPQGYGARVEVGSSEARCTTHRHGSWSLTEANMRLGHTGPNQRHVCTQGG